MHHLMHSLFILVINFAFIAILYVFQYNMEIELIKKYSPFKTEREILQQFSNIKDQTGEKMLGCKVRSTLKRNDAYPRCRPGLRPISIIVMFEHIEKRLLCDNKIKNACF